MHAARERWPGPPHVGLYEERYRAIGGYSTGMKQRVKLEALVRGRLSCSTSRPAASTGRPRRDARAGPTDQDQVRDRRHRRQPPLEIGRVWLPRGDRCEAPPRRSTQGVHRADGVAIEVEEGARLSRGLIGHHGRWPTAGQHSGVAEEERIRHRARPIASWVRRWFTSTAPPGLRPLPRRAARGSPNPRTTRPAGASRAARRRSRPWDIGRSSGPGGSIYDLGYQAYDGPRLGRGSAVQALFRQTIASCFGIGRGGRAKIAPLVLAALAILPAVLAVGFSALAAQAGPAGGAIEDASPICYQSYHGLVAILIMLFCAAQAPAFRP
jgi:hypothetical protein